MLRAIRPNRNYSTLHLPPRWADGELLGFYLEPFELRAVEQHVDIFRRIKEILSKKDRRKVYLILYLRVDPYKLYEPARWNNIHNFLREKSYQLEMACRTGIPTWRDMIYEYD